MRLKQIIFLLFFIGMGCASDDDNKSAYDYESAKLIQLKKDIETLANASICSEAFECKYIAFGSKPCGGPWTYLIYSTSIDVGLLESKVENYNEQEDSFNIKWNIVSDCSFALAPTSIVCENNMCVSMN